jgi:hypothetical protein
MADPGARRAADPHREVPKTPSGLPDDRFDGTDSGADGWDTPYPPATEGSTSVADETDGPDEPAATPQR